MRALFPVLAGCAVILLTAILAPTAALAQAPVPDRQVPPSVLNEVRLLENRFEVALAADCDSARCFSKGCTYVDHAVADRPRESTLPGLGQESAPSPDGAQEYLTQARCAYAYEQSVEPRDVGALTRRLQNKLSSGWVVVTVTSQRLSPLPPYMQEPPADEPEEDTEDTDVVVEPVMEIPDPEPVPPWTAGTAARELWTSLLPHFFWMIAVVMVTIAAMMLIWAWRRVGRESLEEKMLLAELARGEGAGSVEVEVQEDPDAGESWSESAFVAEQSEAWHARLDEAAVEGPDEELQALIRERLLARDLPLLAKAVLTFPVTFPGAFPAGAAGGELASAKLALADYLKDVDPDALPGDAAFFRSLNQHALSAVVAQQSDARTALSLREEFGTTGLATLLGQLPSRPAALLFALAPTLVQHELVRLIEPDQLAGMADALLQSNRMSPAENEHLSQLLDAARRGAPPPPGGPVGGGISDRGEAFDAAGPLSILLEGLSPDRRSALFGAALERLHGSLPDWTRGILVSDMLLTLHDETRADLMLGLDTQPLAAWMSSLDPEAQNRVLEGMPNALSASLRASMVFASREQQLNLAERGRRQLATAFQAQLGRLGATFEQVVARTR